MSVDFGPLAKLVGTWKGDKGTDVAPEPDGSEENPYYETIVIDEVGDVTNAEEQVLAVVRYHQVVTRKKNDEVFHDEIGYYIWDAASKSIMQSLTIPRGVCVLAGGTFAGSADDEEITLEFSAKAGDETYGVVQQPFMLEKAKTTGFDHKITVSGNKLSYFETTHLDIYGKSFEHTDTNELERES